MASYCGSARWVAVSWNASAHRSPSGETRQWKSVRKGHRSLFISSYPQTGVNWSFLFCTTTITFEYLRIFFYRYLVLLHFVNLLVVFNSSKLITTNCDSKKWLINKLFVIWSGSWASTLGCRIAKWRPRYPIYRPESRICVPTRLTLRYAIYSIYNLPYFHSYPHFVVLFQLNCILAWCSHGDMNISSLAHVHGSPEECCNYRLWSLRKHARTGWWRHSHASAPTSLLSQCMPHSEKRQVI